MEHTTYPARSCQRPESSDDGIPFQPSQTDYSAQVATAESDAQSFLSSGGTASNTMVLCACSAPTENQNIFTHAAADQALSSIRWLGVEAYRYAFVIAILHGNLDVYGEFHNNFTCSFRQSSTYLLQPDLHSPEWFTSTALLQLCLRQYLDRHAGSFDGRKLQRAIDTGCSSISGRSLLWRYRNWSMAGQRKRADLRHLQRSAMHPSRKWFLNNADRNL